MSDVDARLRFMVEHDPDELVALLVRACRLTHSRERSP